VGLTFNATSLTYQSRPFHLRVSSATSAGPAPAYSAPFRVFQSLLMLHSDLLPTILVNRVLTIALSHSPALGIKPLPQITATLYFTDKERKPTKTVARKEMLAMSCVPSLPVEGTVTFAIKVFELSAKHDGAPFVLKFETKENHDIAPCYTTPFNVVKSFRSTATEPPKISSKRQRIAPALSSTSIDKPGDFSSLYYQHAENLPQYSQTCLADTHRLCEEMHHLCSQMHALLTRN
jgi:hypothetical protein